MAADTVFLLPGQGGYTPGVLTDAIGEHPALPGILAEIDRVAREFGHQGVSGLLTDRFASPASELAGSDPLALQLAVFAAGVAGHRLAEDRYGPAGVLVGHSMGEIAALTVAGAFGLADGARLVCHRAEALAAHAPVPGAMVALELPAARAAHLVGAVADPDLTVAVYNAPRQTVVSGPRPSVDAVARLTRQLGCQATLLTAPHAFHSPGLRLAADAFAQAAAGIRSLPLRAVVHSPVARRRLTDADDIKGLLVRQLTAPVDFLDAVRTLHAEGADRFVECGRAGLARLVRRTVPGDVTVTGLDGTGWPGTGEEPGPRPAAQEPEPVPVPAPEPMASVSGPAPTAPALPVPPIAVAAVPAVTQPPSRSDILSELQELYASTLGYPVEVVTGDADLEADLGIDSLKRAEMLGKVTAHFGLDPAGADGRFIAEPTLGGLAALIVAVLSSTR
ncbi:acyltransferase domain-containing protein [Streptomyces sp. NPDC048603]|uniref:acyltransferase domain-containing protein n=1 Tax=Streptomyces sp. NPDC048603 TaxID=3365577 RepID=UPI00371C64A4